MPEIGSNASQISRRWDLYRIDIKMRWDERHMPLIYSSEHSIRNWLQAYCCFNNLYWFPRNVILYSFMYSYIIYLCVNAFSGHYIWFIISCAIPNYSIVNPLNIITVFELFVNNKSGGVYYRSEVTAVSLPFRLQSPFSCDCKTLEKLDLECKTRTRRPFAGFMSAL